MAIIIVAAMDEKGLIGNGDELPWGEPIVEDVHNFRDLTIGKRICMGRKAWESIGSKPLKDSTENIVLTRNPAFLAVGATTLSNIDAVLQLAENEDLFIVGGAEMYTVFSPFAKKMHLTIVLESFKGDASFPDYARHRWENIERRVCEKTPDNRYSLEFRTLRRISVFP